MKSKLLFSVLAGVSLLCSQTGPSAAIITNLADAKWTHETGGSESVTLREDPQTGAMELLARYPAGHVFAPHWHSVNERIVLLEGRLSLKQGDTERFLDPAASRSCRRVKCSGSRVSRKRAAPFMRTGTGSWISTPLVRPSEEVLGPVPHVRSRAALCR